ncbi:MAG: GntR family transcriptional regulator [Verrucomicrobia bacterium]|nr:GntR family transcriptional regulator [Verrucomicrobiota bacterium]
MYIKATIPPLDRQSPVPLHRQIEHWVREQIATGFLAPGNMLPSVKTLCEQFGGVNHLTVRQALKSLATEGIVKPVQGRGVFVAESKTRLRRVAFIVPLLNSEMTLKIAQGIQGVFQTANIRSVIMDSCWDFQKELDNISQLEDLPLDGAIIWPVTYGDIAERIFKLKIDGFPLVLVDCEFKEIEIPSVVVDNYKGSYDLTQHLVARGRRRVAWLGDPRPSSTQARLNGFRDALNDHGLVCNRALIKDLKLPAPAAPDQPVIFKLVRQLVAHKPRPDAIVFQSDYIAMIGMTELKRLGVKIPQDIAVAGFDDLQETARTDPPLTTVAQPMERIGAEAARLLIQRMEHKNLSPKSVVLPVQLVVRDSS